MATAVQTVNPGADVIGAKVALQANISAAKGLQEVLKTNLGPKGTMKMLVSGAGAVKMTKDGKVLLDEMQIQHPTAAVIARTATAQDDITGDGTTSNVLFTGELLKQAERYTSEGLHPRILVDGIEKGREHVLAMLDSFKTEVKDPLSPSQRDLLLQVARTSLRTKVPEDLADHLTPIVVNAITTIAKTDTPIDLHMVEIMHMRHRSAMDTSFIDGLVLDHGARHPDMPTRSENAFILNINVSLEYEKSAVNSGFFYKDAEERARLVAAERKFTDDKVIKIIEFKKNVIDAKSAADGVQYSFIVVNQKGIDPQSLEMLCKAGIVGIRRAKRRNMERIGRACGGFAINSVEALSEDCLGFAKLVYEHTLGDEKYTFIEGCRNPTSCTVLIKGPNDHTIAQIKDALRDGLRAVGNVLEDKAVIPGAGAFELAAHVALNKFLRQVEGKAKLGVRAFADALLIVPKTLAQNSGLDAQSCLIELVGEAEKGHVIGMDIDTGKPILPAQAGIWDNYRVKKQFLHLGSLIAIKLLLVDEIMRAGRKMGKN